MQSREGQFD
nr:unnamed protein product [Callosobruchus chinensis]CAH7723152.1 unnamed protein product [Callosobruchus chinensis]CAH7747140.1 unnamed protein product [Callosobruchus chinensis]CAH7765018.1 unnamed protein product [Callosobruchus chinensis]CAH7767154.1 unnamed protein product [Callosobruchus chinensis]